jgi:hypothetical protein
MSALSNKAAQALESILNDLSQLTDALTRFRDGEATESDMRIMKEFHWDTENTFTHSGSTADLRCMQCGGWSLTLDDDEIACPACMEKIRQEVSQ